VAPCPPPLSQAEREARPPPPALQRSPKRVRAEGSPRGSKPQTSSRQLPETALITSGNRSPRAQLPEPANPQPGGCRPQEQRPRDDKNTDDSDGSYDDLYLPTGGQPTPSSARSLAEGPAYSSRSAQNLKNQLATGKRADSLVSNPGLGANERVEARPPRTLFGAEACGPISQSRLVPQAGAQSTSLNEAARRDTAALNCARNPPPSRPARRWQNPGHSASDDEDWEDTSEMERQWGRGGIVRAQVQAVVIRHRTVRRIPHVALRVGWFQRVS
jgi:hypothetical protein